MPWTVQDVPLGDRSVLHAAAAGHGTAWVFGIGVDVHPFRTLVFRRVDDGWLRVEVPSIGRANRAVVLSPDELWVVGDGTSLHRVGDEWRSAGCTGRPGRRSRCTGPGRAGRCCGCRCRVPVRVSWLTCWRWRRTTCGRAATGGRPANVAGSRCSRTGTAGRGRRWPGRTGRVSCGR